MEEDTELEEGEDVELEEGEAKEEVDPDTDFSYLDKKLQLLLGDEQRDFQAGNLSTASLGPKYGGYGTFLPTHARAPPLLSPAPVPDPPRGPPAVEPRAATNGIAESVKHSESISFQQLSLNDHGAADRAIASKMLKLKIKLGKGATEEEQRKALYNGFCLDVSQSLSLGDDDISSDSNVESPLPSPMSIIQIMTSHWSQGCLLSPLSSSPWNILDSKDSVPALEIPGDPTSRGRLRGSKADLKPVVGSGLGRNKGSGGSRDIYLTEGKNSTLVADGDGRKRGKKKPDAGKKTSKKTAGVELGKEDAEIIQELLPKDSQHYPTIIGSEGGIDFKGEHEDIKATEVDVLKDRGNKEAPRKDIEKVLVHKDGDLEGGKESSEQFCKEVGKEGIAGGAKESLKGVRGKNKKDHVMNPKSEELPKDGVKAVGSSRGANRKNNNNVSTRKSGANSQRGSKTIQGRKMSLKELEKEPPSLPDIPKQENLATGVIPLAPAVVPQLVLDNWVACDSCEQWRLLMPTVDPDSLPKKWRCKMMYWLQGMNNCKYKEEETTAAVYNYLGLQNPTLLPPAASVPQQISAPVAEPLADTVSPEAVPKKTTVPATTKKGVARKLGGPGSKSGKSKGVEGAAKSKRVNEMGTDSNEDGNATVAEKPKQGAKAKNKRARTSEVEDTRTKKKVSQEQERIVDSSHTRNVADLEPNQVKKERGAIQTSIVPAKRKKLESLDEMADAPSPKANKSAQEKISVEEQYASIPDSNKGIMKGTVNKRMRKDHALQNLRDTEQSTPQVTDLISGVEVIRDTNIDHEKHREEREMTRHSAEESRSRQDVLEMEMRRSIVDQNDTEQRMQGKHQEAGLHPDRPHPAGLPEKTTYMEGSNPSHSSKISTSSLQSSSTRLKAVGSPLESTISSSPVRVTNVIKELSTSRDGPGDRLLSDKNCMKQRSCSPGPKHVRDSSRGSSWDEGELRHAGRSENTARPRKYDNNGEARDVDWYHEERGGYHGRSPPYRKQWQAHFSHDSDAEIDEHLRRRNYTRDRDSGRDRLGIRSSTHTEQDDRHSRETSTRDDRDHPSSGGSGLEKPGHRPWNNDQQTGVGKRFSSRDDAILANLQGHGSRSGNPIRDPSRENDLAVPMKEGKMSIVGPADPLVGIKRPGVPLNGRIVAEKGDATKREDVELDVLKSSVAEVVRSPARRELIEVQRLANAAMKEATGLKHTADRLKTTSENAGESTSLYLQAALKFLQAASMLEPVHTDSAWQGRYCAVTYKRSGDLRASALAYTCAAVARARVMLSKQACFARDCTEFQGAAQVTCGPNLESSGESPSSSSASDVDNLHSHHALLPGNKVSMGKPVTIPTQRLMGATAGASHILSARLRPATTRVLRDANDVNALLESWLKAAEATAKAEASSNKDGMVAVRRVGELGGFGDIDGIVRLVRLAMEAIGH